MIKGKSFRQPAIDIFRRLARFQLSNLCIAGCALLIAGAIADRLDAKPAKTDVAGEWSLADYFSAHVQAGGHASDGKVKLCILRLDENCKSRRYLIVGDVAVVTAVRRQQSHIVFVNDVGKSSEGWVPQMRMARMPAWNGPQSDWVGTWATDEKEIMVWQSRGDGYLIAQGAASWGADDPDRVQRGAVHEGAFLAKFRPLRDMAAFAEGDEADREPGLVFRDGQGNIHKTLGIDAQRQYLCKVHMRKLGIYLVVEDNGNCGGANVTFRDVYRRIKR